MKIVQEMNAVCHVLSGMTHERLGIVTEIVKHQVFKVSYFSELIQNYKSQAEREHDIENKILGFAKQKTSTLFNLDRVEAQFSNKTTEWFEIEITFYEIEHKVRGNIFYPKKEFDESALDAIKENGDDNVDTQLVNTTGAKKLLQSDSRVDRSNHSIADQPIKTSGDPDR